MVKYRKDERQSEIRSDRESKMNKRDRKRGLRAVGAYVGRDDSQWYKQVSEQKKK